MILIRLVTSKNLPEYYPVTVHIACLSLFKAIFPATRLWQQFWSSPKEIYQEKIYIFNKANSIEPLWLLIELNAHNEVHKLVLLPIHVILNDIPETKRVDRIAALHLQES